jgi:hypothetical protein
MSSSMKKSFRFMWRGVSWHHWHCACHWVHSRGFP